jgi:hypothetical protein
MAELLAASKPQVQERSLDELGPQRERAAVRT